MVWLTCELRRADVIKIALYRDHCAALEARTGLAGGNRTIGVARDRAREVAAQMTKPAESLASAADLLKHTAPPASGGLTERRSRRT